MGEWMGTVLTLCVVVACLCVVYRTFAVREPAPDRPDIKVLASSMLDMAAKNGELCDRVMAFTSEGREGLRYKLEIEELRRQNAEHTAWRQVAAASSLVGLTNNHEPRMPADTGTPDLPGSDQSPDS